MSDADYIKNLEAENERLKIKIQNMSVPKGYVALKFDDGSNKLMLSFNVEALQDVSHEFGLDLKSAIIGAVMESVKVELDKILEKKGFA